MIEVLVKELPYYNRKLDALIDNTYQWYIFRDRSDVFYVGESGNILHRVRYHRTMNPIIYQNKPDALLWLVQFLTLDDVHTMLMHTNVFYNQCTTRVRRVAIERYLIQELQPCFNVRR